MDSCILAVLFQINYKAVQCTAFLLYVFICMKLVKEHIIPNDTVAEFIMSGKSTFLAYSMESERTLMFTVRIKKGKRPVYFVSVVMPTHKKKLIGTIVHTDLNSLKNSNPKGKYITVFRWIFNHYVLYKNFNNKVKLLHLGKCKYCNTYLDDLESEDGVCSHCKVINQY